MQRVCVVLHDVAPARWAGCRRVLGELQRVADARGVELPLTLLVVPQWHGQSTLPRNYLPWLRRLAQQGHQLALHGLTHRDDRPHGKGLRQFLLRRAFTAGEGEFAALTRLQAAQRLRTGRAWAAHHRLPLRGFVAPAWLLGDDAWQALRASGFDHTATLTRVHALPDGPATPAPSLMFSTRSAWRRGASWAWNRWLAWRHRDAPLLRLDLHPDDADHPALRALWTRWLDQALTTRQPVRLREAALSARVAGVAPAPR